MTILIIKENVIRINLRDLININLKVIFEVVIKILENDIIKIFYQRVIIFINKKDKENVIPKDLNIKINFYQKEDDVEIMIKDKEIVNLMNFFVMDLKNLKVFINIEINIFNLISIDVKVNNIITITEHKQVSNYKKVKIIINVKVVR